MKVKFKVEGLKELDAGLAEFRPATARAIMVRAMIAAAEPMVSVARRMAPDDPETGAPDLHTSIEAGGKISNNTGKAQYAAVMKSGGTKSQAASALRDARREASGGSFAVAFVGPSVPKSFSAKEKKRHAIKAIVGEFGSKKQSAHPYMRPAFDSTARIVINNVAGALKKEIAKAAERARKRALKKAGK